jgi:hypothetical protein
MKQARLDQRPLLHTLLHAPERAATLSLAQWDPTIRASRAAGLQARLGVQLAESGHLPKVPVQPRAHLEAAMIVAAKHARDTRWEVELIRRALRPLGLRIILLKGAAYLLAGLPAASGRTFGDIDVLVPYAAIDRAENELRLNGWAGSPKSAYDDRYYRTWMHQIPPLTHITRGTTIDVHHAIVPRTLRAQIPPEPFFEAAREVPAIPGLAVLSPEDMVLHSATHLFYEGEFDRGLRDVSDLDLLLRHFGQDPRFWPSVVRRAETLQLSRPLYYAVMWSHRLFGTPIPPEPFSLIQRFAPAAPIRLMMDALLSRALTPPHRLCRAPGTGPALWLLYVRGHAIRMPFRILLPHLARKAFIRLQPKES